MSQLGVAGEALREPLSDGESLDMKKQREIEKKAKQEEKMRKFEEKKKKLEAQELLKKEQSKTSDASKAPSKVQKPVQSDVPSPAMSSTTTDGGKKSFSQPMAPAYDPTAVESGWYPWWEKQGFFKPEISGVDATSNPKGRFVMVIPPPNVTGSLHLGHALTNAIQDAITRWHRMRGVTTLWNPGCDHAGIATQVVVEKKLWRERHLTRHDLGREAFVSEVWKWKEQYGDRIYSQLRRMGSSYDWSRVVFTMDDKLCHAVTEAFVRLYELGLVYRSTRLVNWCSVLKTAISNVEVDYKELTGRTRMTVPGHGDTEYEFGVLTEFAYFLEDDVHQEIVVSTLRLETMLGDVAVAVHPTDERYTRFHGKYLTHPLLLNRKIPVIVDTMVDPQFGTGAVKITPAHDFNDFECGKRHHLPSINVLTEDGCMNDVHPLFHGMKRFDARNKMLAMAKEQGWYRGQHDHAVNVPICSRTGDVVEPMMKPQWFVKCDVLAQQACEAVRSGALQIIPSMFEKTWFSWMENLNDWCISRQLWWGHRIPAYKIILPSHHQGDSKDDDMSSHWIAARSEEEARRKVKERFPLVDIHQVKLEQDADVLDTWFSAALFPFSTFGWPEKSPDFENFYPTSLLETGHDILFFWVARMVMLGQALTGQLPFKQVYLHAMIRDAHGRKMSKSLGNVIDPLDVIEGVSLDTLQKRLDESNLKKDEIAKGKLVLKDDYPEGILQCGTDALRFALCAYTLQARDINLNVKRIYGYRQFCNKIWNATKFVLMKLGEAFLPWADLTGKAHELSMGDRWILSRMESCMDACNKGFRDYDFPSSTTAIYSFLLYDFCDVYIELAKPALNDTRHLHRSELIKNILYMCLHNALRLLSPFMPFLTEELFHRLPAHPRDHRETIAIAPYPESTGVWFNANVEIEFEFIQQIAKASRSLVADYFKHNQKAMLYVMCKSAQASVLATREHATLMALTRAAQLILLSETSPIPDGCVVKAVREDCHVFLLVKGLVNVDEEILKLDKEKQKVQSQFDGLLKQTKIKDYVEKVPELIRESNEQKLSVLSADMNVLAKAIENFLKIHS